MRKKKSLVVSLVLAFALMLSAPFALTFNKKETAKAEVAFAANAVGLFEFSATNTTYQQYLSPAVATTNISGVTTSQQYTGIALPLAKQGSTADYPVEAKAKLIDVTNATKDDALISFNSNNAWRSYKVQLHDGTNYIDVYFAKASQEYGYIVGSTNNAIYVQAGGQSLKGGMENGAFVSGTTGTSIDVNDLTIYYDASEKAIYTNNASGEKVLVRDLDATDDASTEGVDEGATNGGDTAFAGFTGPVRIKISHNSGGGATAPTSPTILNYGVVVTALNGLDLTHNGLGYLAGYNLTDGVVSKSAYVAGGETTLPVGEAYAVPALERRDGEELAVGEDEGWTTTVYNENKEDVTADTLLDNVFTATESGKYYIYRTKTVESTTTVVSETITAVVAGFENEYANIFEAKKATDGVGVATVSFPTDLTTGASKLPAYAQNSLGNSGAIVTYADVWARATSGGQEQKLGKSYVHIPSVKISDNTASTTLVSATPVSKVNNTIDALRGMTILVYEKANINNYFTLTVYNFNNATTHAQASATGQTPWGTRGADKTQGNIHLSGLGNGFGHTEIKVQYDNANKAVYINNTLIRDFDDTDNDNGLEPRVLWEGFKTDEVGIMIFNTAGGGDLVVKNVDGKDLSYSLLEKQDGSYTAGLVTPITADNYNANIKAVVGESVIVPAPTSKKITGEFTERTDITVAKVRVNGGEAVAYEKGVTSFTAVAGLNTIEYLGEGDGVVAKAYAFAYDGSQYGEVDGATISQGLNNPVAMFTPAPFNALDKDHHGVSARNTDGLLVSVDRPTSGLEESVTATLDKKIYVGDNDNTKPLFDFVFANEQVQRSINNFTITLTDENGKYVEIYMDYQIPSGSGSANYYGGVATCDNILVRVHANGKENLQLRHRTDQWYTGGAFVTGSNGMSGYYAGKVTLYYNKAEQTLSFGTGQTLGDNTLLVHLDPTPEQKETYHYQDQHSGNALGNELTVSFKFTFAGDDNYTGDTSNSTYAPSGKAERASILLMNLDGQSLAQYSGAYANNGVKVAKTVADDNNFYKVGDTVTLPAVTEYYNVLAEGGVATGAVEGYTVDVKKPDGTVVNADLAPGANFTATEFGTYTLVYKFSNRENIEKTIKVTTKTIALSTNDATKITVDTTDNNGLGGALPNYTLTEDGYVNVKITPASGYAITSAKIDGVEKIVDVDLTGAQLSFMVAYADIANASTLEATVTAFADITFTISYDANGGVLAGTPGTDYKVEYAYDDATFALPTNVTKTGYTFVGWFDGSNNKVEEITQYSTTNYALTARWQANAFTATFNSDGGSAVADQTIYYDGKVTEPSVSKVGYLFLGWFEAGATESYDFDTIVTGNVSLTARWEINDFVVTFSDGIASQTITFGGKVTKPADPTKAGFTFGGWLYGATVYDFDSIVSSNMALTAIWTPANVTVTFDLNGGTGEAPAQSVVVGALAQKPANPTKDGYEFVGWYVGDAKFDFGTEITADITLTAKFIEVTESVAPDASEKESEGCGKEAVGLLAVVLSALAVVFVTKRK